MTPTAPRTKPRRPAAGKASVAVELSPALQELRGIIVRVIARKPSLWTALRVRPTAPILEEGLGAANPDGTVSVAGIVEQLEPNAEMLFRGHWADSKYGRQFVPVESEILHPSDERGIALELERALPHVGQIRARAIIELFGRGQAGLPGVWAALEQTDLADRLVEAKVCPPDHAAVIAAACQQTRHQRELRAWLRARGCGPAQSAQIIEEYGDAAQQLVEQDPYRLMELDRWGFLSADAIAQNLRIPKEHPGRVRAAIVHCLREAADNQGHLYLPLNTPDDVPRRRKLHEHQRCGLLDRLVPWDVDPEHALHALREMDRASREDLARKEEGLLAEEDPKALRRRRIRVIVDGEGTEARASLLPYWEAEQEAVRRVLEMLEGSVEVVPAGAGQQRLELVTEPVQDNDEDDWASMLAEAERMVS